MDKRQQKSRKAIFQAFTNLLNTKKYHSITVQDIIDEANIGRSTFYAHFDTKDELLRDLCKELFDHIIAAAMNENDYRGLYNCENAPNSVTGHILQHLLENDMNILTLLNSENNELFLSYFKSGMEEFVRNQFLVGAERNNFTVSDDFLVNHIAGSFVDMVQWWLRGNRKQTPQELDEWFRSVILPAL